MKRLSAAVAMFFSLSLPLSAHELWIEPEQFYHPNGQSVRAALINGIDFEGNSLVYSTRNFLRLERQSGSENISIEGELGTRPAVSLTDLPDGLLVLGYESNPSRLGYSKWEKFQSFADEKGLENALDVHTARGLPVDKFSEGYTRYSKSLVGINEASGQDRPFGFEVEWVAHTNPYTETAGTFSAQLIYQNTPLPDFQVDVFQRDPSGALERWKIRTDANGMIAISTMAEHDYMLDAVVFREPSPQLLERMDVAWETLWANLTFGVR